MGQAHFRHGHATRSKNWHGSILFEASSSKEVFFFFFFKCILSMLSVLETMIKMREAGEAGWDSMAIGAVSEE